jgi:uncharacterized protein YfdQ (DUF2303 family)
MAPNQGRDGRVTPTAEAFISPPSGDAEAIRVFADLAQKAAGELIPTVLELSEDRAGLPKKIPAAIKSGERPELQSVKRLFEEWRLAPERREGTAETTTRASFIDLVNLHKGASSALFAKTTWPEPALTAVIDYHSGQAAANCAHRVRYAFPLTDEFEAWVSNNGKAFNQVEFAAFVEEHIADMAVADMAADGELEKLFRTRFALPTEMVDLSRGLRVNVDERVTNAFTLQSGEAEIQFSTEHKGADGAKLVVPGLFLLCLPVFIDGDMVRVPARLRYRVLPGEGAIKWSYQLYRWELLLRERVRSDLAVVVKQTALPAFEGAPEKRLNGAA